MRCAPSGAIYPRYLENSIKVPPYSYAWAQPLTPHSQKFDSEINIADPIFAPPKREDIVKNLMGAVQDALTAEEALFSRLAGREDLNGLPSFEKPEEPKVDYLEFQRPLPGTPAAAEIIPLSDRSPAELAFLAAMEGERKIAEERAAG
jgi:hypothetical protein